MSVQVIDLPAFLGRALCPSSWEQEAKANAIETEMENGIINVRRRFTGSIIFAEVSINFAADRYPDFDDLFHTRCQDGVHPTWFIPPHLIDTGLKQAWRFASVPKYTWMSKEAFKVSFSLYRIGSWPEVAL